MSIICNYYYTITENGKRRLIIGYELRKLLLARYKAQKNMYEYHRQLRKTAAQKEQAKELKQRSDLAGKSIEDMETALNGAMEKLDLAKSELDDRIKALSDLQQETDLEIDGVKNEIEEALVALDAAGGLFSDNFSNVENMEIPDDLEERIMKLETEIGFIARQTELRPAAIATIEAMRENGYELRETAEKDGLISYFEQVDTGRQIAVSVARPEKNEQGETWELVAETYKMTGESCLFEIEDFETAMEETGLGLMKGGGLRSYPKDSKSADREKRGLLPPLRESGVVPKGRETGTNREAE